MRNFILVLTTLLNHILDVIKDSERLQPGDRRTDLCLQQGKVYALDVAARAIEQLANDHLDHWFYKLNRYSWDDVVTRRVQLKEVMDKIACAVSDHEVISDAIKDDLIRV